MNNLSIGRDASSAGLTTVNFSNALSAQNRWAVILAGGDGTRLLPLTRKIAGDERPKQFCRIISHNTLLDETRRRVALAIPPAGTTFVLTEKHECFYAGKLADVPRENLIVQPKNAGTAPAILYSLLRLAKRNPAAAVAFFPSDHYFAVPFFWTTQFEATLLYIGHAKDWDEIVFQGNVQERNFLAFYVKNKRVLAVAGMNRDREMAILEELMRLNRIPAPERLKSGAVNFLEQSRGNAGLF